MEHKISENKLIEIYCFVDESIKIINHKLMEINPGKIHVYKKGLSMSETCTLLILYHQSGYKCFEYFYNSLDYNYLKSYFPEIPHIKSFYERQKKCTIYLIGILLIKLSLSEKNNVFFIDSTKIEVCKPLRMSRNKVFKDLAKKSKTSTGWFFGFKLHLVINDIGEIVNYRISAGDISDNNHQLLIQLLKGLTGCCVGDKGYITSLFTELYQQGIKIITRLRSNMKGGLRTLFESKILRKRGIIEIVNDILKSVCDLEHSRHRNTEHAAQSIHTALIAYCFIDKKPEMILKKLIAA